MNFGALIDTSVDRNSVLTGLYGVTLHLHCSNEQVGNELRSHCPIIFGFEKI